jgi:single-stranded DNA-binding protein
MTTLSLQKKANQVENFIKKASRVLLEFQVAQAKWERAHGIGKIYSSVDALIRDATRKASRA